MPPGNRNQEPSKDKSEYVVPLACFNCGYVASYNIPLKKRFWAYQTKGVNIESGEEVWPQEWSMYGSPKNEHAEKNVLLLCEKCQLPMLYRTPYGVPIMSEILSTD